MAISCTKEKVKDALMTLDNTNKATKDIWFLDSGRSNHMIGQRHLFKEIDLSKKVKVKMGNGKKIQVEGKGVVKLEAIAEKQKLIYDVQYAPDLDYNLLSVGQLMTTGHTLLFDEGVCSITNKRLVKWSALSLCQVIILFLLM